jgi:cation transport ATPase
MKMNIAFSMAWNALGLTLASIGLLVPILAAVLQEAGCISVIINSALLLLYK